MLQFLMWGYITVALDMLDITFPKVGLGIVLNFSNTSNIHMLDKSI